MAFKKSIPGMFPGIIYLLCLSVLAGCGSSRKLSTNFLYFQKSMNSLETIQRVPVIIKVNDLLTIQITSRSTNQEQVAVYNPPANTANGISRAYQVNSDGHIDLPLLGDVMAAGLTREQLQARLKEKLSNYIKDPAVIVRFADFKINVLGEVKLPGTHK